MAGKLSAILNVLPDLLKISRLRGTRDSCSITLNIERSERYMNNMNYLVSILMSLFVGLGGFVLAFKIFDWLTPSIHFEQSLKDQREALRGRFLER